MRNKRELPIALDAPSIAYHGNAFPLGMLKANINNFDIWLCNKMINCTCKSNNSFFNVYDNDIWSKKEKIIDGQFMNLYSECLKYSGLDIIELNKSMIDNGKYVTGVYNEYYIPGKEAFQQYNFQHDYMLYGYDDERSLFKSVGYVKEGKYLPFDIAYEDFYKSLTSFDKMKRVWTCFHTVRKDFEPEIDIKTIKEQLENYLCSRKDIGSSATDEKYGIEVWNSFIEYIKNIGDRPLDFRYSRVFMEHKNIMKRRLEVMLEKAYIKDSSLIARYTETVSTPAQVNHNLFLKYDMTFEKRMLTRIQDGLNNIIKNEKKLLEEFVGAL